MPCHGKIHCTSFNDGNPMINGKNALVTVTVDLGCLGCRINQASIMSHFTHTKHVSSPTYKSGPPLPPPYHNIVLSGLAMLHLALAGATDCTRKLPLSWRVAVKGSLGSYPSVTRFNTRFPRSGRNVPAAVQCSRTCGGGARALRSETHASALADPPANGRPCCAAHFSTSACYAMAHAHLNSPPCKGQSRQLPRRPLSQGLRSAPFD